MKKTKIILALWLAVFLIIPPNVMAEAVGAITYIEGRVDIFSADGDRFIPAVVGDKVTSGDSIRTKSYSKAEITFDDESVVQIADTSKITVREYEIDEAGNRKKGVIDLARGRMRAVVSKAKDKTAFDVNTPNASGSVKGSDVFIGYQKSATSILVAEGILRTVNPQFPDETIDVGKGWAAYVPHNAPPQEPRAYLPAEKKAYESAISPDMKEAEGMIKGNEVTRATIVKLSGTVIIKPKGSTKQHMPTLNEVLNADDIIETKENGKIVISMDNGHFLTLKPNSQIIIKILSKDPDTGDYQNLFECKYGKVIAKLRKVKKNSSFEIKTPTVTCGVRGTIMYLEVLRGITKAFFEGGDGFVKGLSSGILQIIQAGKKTTVDADGNIGNPTDTTDEDRQDFGSGFGDEGGDEYGYSGTGDDTGTTGTGDPGTTGGTTDPPADTDTTGTGDNQLFDDITPDDTSTGDGSGSGSDTTPSTSQPVDDIIVGIGAGYQDGDYRMNGIVLGESISTDGDGKSGNWAAIFGGSYESRSTTVRSTGGVENSWLMNFVGMSINKDYFSEYSDGYSGPSYLRAGASDIVDLPAYSTAPRPTSYWLGMINGNNWQEGSFQAPFTGIFIGHGNTRGSFKLGVISGAVSGSIGEYVELSEIMDSDLMAEVASTFSSEWVAEGSGTWMEIEDMLDLSSLSDMISALNDTLHATAIPITEVYPTQLDYLGGTTGIIDASMDMSVFAATDSVSIWAVDFWGNHDGLVSVGDAINFTDEVFDAAISAIGDNVSLEILEWGNNEWYAGVTGSVNGQDVIGTAGGDYSDPGCESPGTFSGSGAGIGVDIPSLGDVD
ncbi:MAG: FecR domain-containing protein [Candidatus Omnitrophica bacterium]|nr:FecR domain-containing protein [Candidatus Omnitrophota bacterium]